MSHILTLILTKAPIGCRTCTDKNAELQEESITQRHIFMHNLMMLHCTGTAAMSKDASADVHGKNEKCSLAVNDKVLRVKRDDCKL